MQYIGEPNGKEERLFKKYKTLFIRSTRLLSDVFVMSNMRTVQLILFLGA